MQPLNAVGSAAGVVQLMRRSLMQPDELEHCGMAILISPRIALTCAHVVNAAMPRMLEAVEPPPADTRILIGFPMLPGLQTRKCRILKWRKMGEKPLDDIAVLWLEQAAPSEAGINVIAAIDGDRNEGRDLTLFGLRCGRSVGEHVQARLLGKATEAWRHIDVANGGGVEPGFSGAGIWDEENKATIGMAARRYDLDTAYFLPTEALVEFAGDIPFERRDISSVFAPTFTAFGAVLFGVATLHLLADRIREFPKFLSLGLGNEIVAAFWGLHLIVCLMPFLLWKMLSFARAYREHPWWMRVPQFGFFGSPARPSATRFAAVATLSLLIVWPLYLNGHFMRRLHGNEMKVYIDVQAHGYDGASLTAAGENCGTDRSKGYCTHPKAGLYSLVPPAVADKGGYFDSFYFIGGLDRRNPEAVAFFPIIQPVALWILTLGCLSCSMLLFWLVARPSRRLIDAPTVIDSSP